MRIVIEGKVIWYSRILGLYKMEVKLTGCMKRCR